MIPRLDISLLPSWALTRARTHPTAPRSQGPIGRAIASGIGAALLLMGTACATNPTQAPVAASGTPTTPPKVTTPSTTTTATAEATASPSSVVGAPTGPASTPTAVPATRVPTAAPSAAAVAAQPAPTSAGPMAAPPNQPAATATPIPTLPPPTPIPTVPKPSAERTTESWVDGPAQFQKGQPTSVQVAAGEGARLGSQGDTYSPSGELLSEVHETSFPFNNAVLSWNADAPSGTSLRFELRVRGEGGWSGWYAMGQWSANGGRSISGQADTNGKVDIDTLKLNATATALQYRVKMVSSSTGNSPLLRQVAVVYSDLRKGLSGPPLERPAGAVRDLNVPGHSQLEQDPSVALKICSPTSLAMVLQYWGLNKTVPEVYSGVQDGTTGIYGDWPLNTAFAGANGFKARVDRFYAVEQLEQEIAAGRPAIISVAYSAGELTGAAASSTDGHLIVVRGFTPQGDVIVNDPVAANSRSVRLVYKRDQLSRVWLRSGGIVYLVAPR